MKHTPIFILHGWTVSPEIVQKWQPVINLLKKVGYDVNLLMLPGLTQPLAESWDLNQYVEWVSQQIGAESAIVIGHSFGGQVAVRLCAGYPQLVSKLVLIDSSGIPDRRLSKILKRSVFYIVAKVGKILPFSEQFRPLLYKLAREQDYYQASQMQRQTMARVLRENVSKNALTIQTPTLIIWGKLDTTTPLFMGEEYLQLIRDSRLKIIDQARHSPQYSHPEQVADILITWLNSSGDQRQKAQIK